MLIAWVRVDTIVYSAVVSACEKVGHWTVALSLLAEMVLFRLGFPWICLNGSM